MAVSIVGMDGNAVIVNYRSDRESADSVVQSIVSGGGQAHAVAADVTKPDDVERLLQTTLETFGSLDALVCNANTVNPRYESIEDLGWEDFQSKVVGELAGVFHLTQ